MIARFKPEARPISPKPLSITAITKPPITASVNFPRPPNKLTPPTTAAAIALNTIDLPAAASTDACLDANKIPAIPAKVDEIINTVMRTRLTLIPARLAASAFPPTA